MKIWMTVLYYPYLVMWNSVVRELWCFKLRMCLFLNKSNKIFSWWIGQIGCYDKFQKMKSFGWAILFVNNSTHLERGNILPTFLSTQKETSLYVFHFSYKKPWKMETDVSLGWKKLMNFCMAIRQTFLNNFNFKTSFYTIWIFSIKNISFVFRK